MKRALIFALPVFTLIFFFSLTVAAQEINDPCQDDTTRFVVPLADPGLNVPRLQTILQSRLSEQTTCLLFNGTFRLGGHGDFIIDIGQLFSGTPQEVHISGLNIERRVASENYLLTITNDTTTRVIVTNLHLSGVTNGLKLMGAGPIEVRDSTITGAGGEFAARTGACVEIQSSGAVVKSTEILNCNEGMRIAGESSRIEGARIHDSPVCVNIMGNGATITGGEIHHCVTEGIKITGENGQIEGVRIHNAFVCVNILGNGANVKASDISNCGEGIRIAASNTFLGALDAEHFDAERNDIHGNGTGIHLVNGNNNRWPYNLVYHNGPEGVFHAADNAIRIEAGANDSISRPSVVTDETSGAALRCQVDESGRILKREIQFASPSAGMMTIYKTEIFSRYDQANEYVAMCQIAEDGICALENTLLPFIQTECGLRDTYVTALFTNAENSSMLLADPIELGRWSTVAAPSTPMPTGTYGATTTETEPEAPSLENPLTGGPSSVPIGTGGPGTTGQIPEGASYSVQGKMSCSLTTAAAGKNLAGIFIVFLSPLVLFLRRRIH